MLRCLSFVGLLLTIAASAAQANHVRPAGGTPLRVPLVPAYEPCVEVDTTYTNPDQPACSSPQQSSGYLTVGTNDANQRPPQSTGTARMDVLLGDPATPQNEADIALQVTVYDVRCQALEEACSVPIGSPDHALSDYTGSLRAVAESQRTDHRNGAANAVTAVSDFYVFNFAVPCTTTAATTIGSTCSASTTSNATLPGQITETQRAVIEINNVQLWDGGVDGDPDTQPSDGTASQVFMRSGVFVP